MIKVLDGGLLSSIQDLGRHGFQSDGVSVSGAMDKLALKLGNILNANETSLAGIEITYSGFKCEFLSDMTIALTGADLDYEINGEKVSINESLHINKYDILDSKSQISGIRGYLTVLGGVDVDEVLASKSTHLKGGFGGFKGRRLKANDIIKTNKNNQKPLKFKRIIDEKLIDEIYKSRIIRVILGPEDHKFTDNAIKAFLSSEYKITNNSDRMAYRLSGERIEHVDGADILSSPLTYGSIQVPASGEPIIMMADRQTTGGYTKIGHVISLDHSYLSQLESGQVLEFKEISIEKSQELFRKLNRKILELEKTFSSERLSMESLRRFNIRINEKNYNIRLSIES